MYNMTGKLTLVCKNCFNVPSATLKQICSKYCYTFCICIKQYHYAFLCCSHLYFLTLCVHIHIKVVTCDFYTGSEEIWDFFVISEWTTISNKTLCVQVSRCMGTPCMTFVMYIRTICYIHDSKMWDFMSNLKSQKQISQQNVFSPVWTLLCILTCAVQ